MKQRDWLYWALVIIAALTIFSGLFQVMAPGLELRLLSAEVTPTTTHFFGIVGMFMVLFGGAFLHALRSAGDQRVLVVWCSLQKLGASAAVGLGVLHHLFSPLALLVAGFDLGSGLLGIWYWGRLQAVP
jgi:Na+-driven multidrug efflux pump